MENNYSEKDMIEFAEWIDRNNLGLIEWKVWKSFEESSERGISCKTTKELLQLWEKERYLSEYPIYPDLN